MLKNIPFTKGIKFPSQINVRVSREAKDMEKILKGRGVKTGELLRELIVEALNQAVKQTDPK